MSFINSAFGELPLGRISLRVKRPQCSICLTVNELTAQCFANSGDSKHVSLQEALQGVHFWKT